MVNLKGLLVFLSHLIWSEDRDEYHYPLCWLISICTQKIYGSILVHLCASCSILYNMLHSSLSITCHNVGYKGYMPQIIDHGDSYLEI